MAGWYGFQLTGEGVDPFVYDAVIRSFSGPKVLKRPSGRIQAPMNAAWAIENFLRAQGLTFKTFPPAKKDPPPFTYGDLLKIQDMRLQPAGMPKPWPDYLLEHQLDFLLRFGHLPGAHAWHAPGAGKTITAIVWGALVPGLSVFVTRAAARGTIASEIRRVTLHEPFVCMGQTPTPIPRETRFVVVGWEGLPFWIDALLEAQPVSAVWDESHKGKNPRRWTAEPKKDASTGETIMAPDGKIALTYKERNNIASASMNLSVKAQRRMATTASPIKDRLRDLWAQLDLVEPRQWGSFMQWAKRYCAAHEGEFGGWDTTGRASGPLLAELQARLSFSVHSVPFSVTHKNLPPLRRMVTYLGAEVLMKGKEFSWQASEREAKAEGINLGRDQAAFFHKLRRAADMKRPAAIDLVVEAAKRDTTDNARGGKVVVFTALRKDCEKFHQALVKALPKTVATWMAHGEHSTTMRDRIKDEYMAHPGPCVLVGTGDAWGESINLHDSDLALIVMLPWTPGQIIQWEGRFKRQGMKRPCIVHYLIAQGTADEHMAQKLIEKLPAVETVVGDEQLQGFGKVIGGTADEEKLMKDIMASVLGAEVDERELNA